MDAALADSLIPALGVLASALVGLAMWGLRLLAKKVENDWIRGVMERSTESVNRAFLEVEQTFVAHAKDKNGDGKLSKEEAGEALDLAVGKAKAYIGQKGLNELGKILGGSDIIDSFLGSGVEANVAKKKLL